MCDVISLKNAMRVKSLYMIKSWSKTKKKITHENQRKCLNKYPYKRWVKNGIRNLLMPADAGGSANIIYHMWRISLLCGSRIVIDLTK